MTMGFTIRPVRKSDVHLVRQHRKRTFCEAGHAAPMVKLLDQGFRHWLLPRIDDGRYFGFIAEGSGAAVGGIGLMATDWPPHPLHPSVAARGYVLNVFVEPNWRGRGIARALVVAGEVELMRRGLSYATLHATDLGRPLYERAGWTRTSEMGKGLQEPRIDGDGTN